MDILKYEMAEMYTRISQKQRLKQLLL